MHRIAAAALPRAGGEQGERRHWASSFSGERPRRRSSLAAMPSPGLLRRRPACYERRDLRFSPARQRANAAMLAAVAAKPAPSPGVS